MKWLSLTALGALIASCGAQPDGRGDPVTKSEIKAGGDAAQLSEIDLLRVCKGGVAFRNGRDVRGIHASVVEQRMVRLSYTRDDGKKFAYDCLVEGNVLRFRMIDEAGPGSGPGSWSGRGSRTTFELAPGEIQFKDEFGDGSSTTESVKI